MALFTTIRFSKTALFFKVIWLTSVVSFSFASSAHAHPALVITHIEEFEAKTDLTNDDEATQSIEVIEALVAEYTAQQNLQSDSLSSMPVIAVKEGSAAPSNPDTVQAGDIHTNLEQVSNKDDLIIQADIWDRIRDGFAMPTIEHPSVKVHERRFAKNPTLLSDMINRAEKYLFHVTNAIEQKNMPTELALLPIIESRYDPVALSRTRAAGLWQIMPATGKYLGLKQDWWVDERCSVTASTTAALNYLQSFYKQFGKWDLALAAYNAGAGTVGRAIKRNKKAKKPTGYLHLKLPKETREYLPKLQAIKNIVSNPARYGINMQPIQDKAYFKSVRTPKQIDKSLLAKLAGVTSEEFESLNPQYKRPVIASTEQQAVLLPIDAAHKLNENLSSYDKPLVSWQAYTLQPGERLSRVAKDLGISAKKLSKINQIASHKRFRKPATILVPNHKVINERKNSPEPQLIASIEVLSEYQTVNNLKPQTIQSLNKNVSRNAYHHKKRTTRQKTYLVKRGDTLSQIAQRFHLSLNKLQRLNHLKNRLLKAGQRIRLH